VRTFLRLSVDYMQSNHSVNDSKFSVIICLGRGMHSIEGLPVYYVIKFMALKADVAPQQNA